MPHPRKLTSKTTDPPWRAAARQTRVAHRTPGATPHQPHAHTRRSEISRSGGAPPHSTKPSILGKLLNHQYWARFELAFGFELAAFEIGFEIKFVFEF